MINKVERRIYYILAEQFPNHTIILNGFFSWLKSPKRFPLQLDFFIPDLNLAIEYQGPQHYIYTPRFHRTKAKFAYYKKCDKLKIKQCALNDVKLIELKYTETPIRETLIKKLEKIGIL